MSNCLIAFGANIPGPFGSPSETLKLALEEFQFENLLIQKKSEIYTSLAFPDPEKPKYLNGCVRISVNCNASDVLDRLKRIETKMGRQQSSRWDSRICDLDLLSFDDKVSPSRKTFDYWYKMPLRDQILEKPTELLLPHPRIQDRAFVLKPLLQVAAGWTHPVFNLTVRQMLNFLPKEERYSILPI